MCVPSSLLPDYLPNLSTEDPLYQKGFATYIPLLDMPDILSYFDDHIGMFISDKTKTLRLLSIGCGDGMLDLGLINVISRHFPLLHVEYVGLEPNEYRLTLFKDKLSSYSFASRYDFHFEQVDLDGYEDRQIQEQFNLILCARVLYYMHDRLESIFAQLINKLAIKGKLLAIHQSPSGIAQIIHVLGLNQQSAAHKCNTFHLRQALTALIHQRPSLHFKIIYLDGYVDVTCLKNINSSDETEREKALILFSFLLGKTLTGVDRNLLEKAVVEWILPVIALPKEETNNSYLMFQPAGILIVELR
jgi:SAM-dependent methyltransferase